MKNKKKAMLLALCAVLLVGATVMGTLAYMTDKTGTVTNTFTVGNVTITLDEAKVDEDGKAIDAENDRTTDAQTYKLFPGKEYDKDPTIHVASGSEDCWVFVQIDNGLDGIEATGATIADQMATNWDLMAGTENVYGYKTKLSAGDDAVAFETVKIKADATEDDLADYSNATVTVIGYAIQAEGFASAQAAWTAAGAEALNASVS